VLAGEWPWEPEKPGEREALDEAAQRLAAHAAAKAKRGKR